MKLSWLFNGTMEAHHLTAAYVVVWVVQGGYAAWVALRLRAMARNSPGATEKTSLRS